MAPSNDTSSRGSPARLVDWLIGRPAARDQRHHSLVAAVRENGDVTGVAGERDAARPAAQRAIGGQRDPAIGMDRGDRQRPARHRDPGLRQQPTGHQRLGERHRRGKPPGRAQHGETVGQRRPGPAKLVRDPGERQPGLLQGIPQGLWPHALLRLVDGIGLAKILEDPGRGIDDDIVGVVGHRSVPALVALIVEQRVGDGKPRLLASGLGAGPGYNLK